MREGLPEFDPQEEHVGGDVEGLLVGIKGDVTGEFPRHDRAKVLALRVHDPDPTRAGGEETAGGMDLEAIGHALALAHHLGDVLEDFFAPDGAVGIELVGHPESARAVRVGHVKGFL